MKRKSLLLKPKKIVKILKKAGFTERRQKGSHLILKNEKSGRMVIIPIHNRDLAIGTLKDIIDNSGLTDEQFLELV